MMAGTSLPCLEAYMTRVLDGDRSGCRQIFETARRDCDTPLELFTGLIWPAMERTQHLYRQDRINTTIEHMAQSVAACMGYEAYKGGRGVRGGLLVRWREFRAHRVSAAVGDALMRSGGAKVR